ncbi:gustatory receptor for sugar taste 43a-like [Eurosta solidaginis]|uniref:gustatory receptor for sugar taste 43a-like n=1 Tax=Eurosta solidaginis TaxID=178769 RepID=UPI0035313DAD
MFNTSNSHHANNCSTFGLAVMFILVSCMLHTVATSYFIIIALFNGHDTLYITVQAMWITYHIMRMLFVVEPCHMAASESKKTLQIVSEMNRRGHDPVLAQEIGRFWRELLITNAEITAMGLCSIDRYLLTSFSSSIATYLIILLQFQKGIN